jgi:hypothetical protein
MIDWQSEEVEESLVRTLLRFTLAGLFSIPTMVGTIGVLGLVVRLAAGDADDGGAGAPTLLIGLAVAALLLGGGVHAIRSRFVPGSERWPAIVAFAVAALAAAVLFGTTGQELALLAAVVSAVACLVATAAVWLRV